MKNTVGIIMAGGRGTRLMPMTASISKHLLPIYDKPMIFYALSTLMIARIRNILIIGDIKDIEHYKKFLFDGSKYGLKISYAIQSKPKGIPEAFTIGKKFISKNNVCLILGDNFFYGNGLSSLLTTIKNSNKSILQAVLCLYLVGRVSQTNREQHTTIALVELCLCLSFLLFTALYELV